MNILYISAGTGSYYCGSCLRDLSLVDSLRKLGHTVDVVSLYLPLFPEDGTECSNHPVFLGGVNIYLQEKFSFFRALPASMDRTLNNRGFLRRVAEKWSSTNPVELGPLTLSMLQGEQGYQAKEIQRFTRWLEQRPAPDVICFSNAMLAGLSSAVRATLRVPIFCTLQGEEPFLDDLAEPYRAQAWNQLAKVAPGIDHYIAVSADYGNRIAERLGIPADKITVAYNGIKTEGFEPDTPALRPVEAHPVIGYFARICPHKGAHRLVEAFIGLDARLESLGSPVKPRLRLAGTVTQADEAYLQQLIDQVAQAGLSERVDFQTNVNRAQKIRFLRSLSLFSVPADKTESFGLYLLESLACGVPVVMPRHAAFPEVLEQTGGGLLYDPEAPESLGNALANALKDPEALQSLGEEGQSNIFRSFQAKHMAERVQAIFRSQSDISKHDRVRSQ